MYFPNSGSKVLGHVELVVPDETFYPLSLNDTEPFVSSQQNFKNGYGIFTENNTFLENTFDAYNSDDLCSLNSSLRLLLILISGMIIDVFQSECETFQPPAVILDSEKLLKKIFYIFKTKMA